MNLDKRSALQRMIEIISETLAGKVPSYEIKLGTYVDVEAKDLKMAELEIVFKGVEPEEAVDLYYEVLERIDKEIDDPVKWKILISPSVEDE